MSFDVFSSLGPVLAAPWRQRRNAGSMWGVAFVVFMVLLGPAVLFGLSAVAAIRSHGDAVMDAQITAVQLLVSALNTTVCAVALLVLAWWAMAVSGILDQNRPALARLVPNHPARLRAALLVGWVAALAAITLLIGVRFDAPLACATIAGVGLAILAASVRWPLLWMLGCVAPFGVGYVVEWPGLPHAIEALRGFWQDQPSMIFLTLAAASTVLLVALIQSGGARHVASDETRRQRAQRFRMRAQGSQPLAVGTRGILDTVLTRPYYAWFRHVLARPASPVFSRLMLGLSPGAHWTASATAVLYGALAMLAGLAVLEGVGLFYAPAASVAPNMLASFSVSIVIALVSPAIQIQARLHQSRREQALLVLLPGVPRGNALSRRLAWQLTGQFLMAWVGALGLAGLSLATAHALRSQSVIPVLLDLSRIFAIAALPMIVSQWRAWSRVGPPTALGPIAPLLLAGLVGLAAWFGPLMGWLSLAAVATLSIGAAAAWCAMRWWRMGAEPSALPIGRLA
jgi:hypothetical protein